jgi:hypothetical protein
MSLSPGEKELLRLVDGRATYLPNVQEGNNKTGLSQRAVEAYDAARKAQEGAAIDDGVPPSDPTGLSVEARVRSLVVSWAPPPPEEYVDHALVELEAPVGTVVKTLQVGGTSVTIPSLTAGTSYRAFVTLVDRWDLESARLSAGDATPTISVADEVDLAAANIIGELGYDNIEQLTAAIAATAVDANAITGTHIAANTIVAGNLAAGNAAFLNAWIEDAAIQNAKIAELSADKISSGTIEAQTITLGAGGTLVSGGAVLHEDGIRLPEVSDLELAYPSDSGGHDWITGPNGGNAPTPYAGMTFYNQNAVDLRRGMLLSADGNNINKRGTIMLRATDGAQNIAATGTTYIEIESNVPGVGGLGGVNFKGYVTAHNHMDVFGNLYCEGDIDFSFATRYAFNATGVRIEGGYITEEVAGASLGAAWGYGDPGGLPHLFFRRMSNFVFVSGRVRNTSGGSNSSTNNIVPAAGVPSIYRPTTFKYLTVPATSGGANYTAQSRVVIENGGDIHLAAGNTLAAGEELSFDGAYYSIG